MEVAHTYLWIYVWIALIICVSGLSNDSDAHELIKNVNFTETEIVTSSDIENLPIEEADDDYADISIYGNETFFTPEGRLTSTTTSTLAVLNQFPYMVHISSTVQNSGTARPCSGALLTAEYVITIAACVYDATAITVTAATIDLTETASATVLVTRTGTAIVHPKYTINNYNYGIALIKVATPYTLGTNIGTINLAYKYNTDEHKDVSGRAMRVIGYGSTTANTPATYSLRYASMNVLSKAKCVSKMRGRNVVPAAFQDCLDTDSGTVGACNLADLGGVLVYKFDSDSSATLAGLLNYYYSCGTATPNMFLRVGPHWDWIRKYIQVYDNIG